MLADLPWPTTELAEGVELVARGGTVSITLRAGREDARRIAVVAFTGVRAHRHRAEGVSTAWHVRTAYDRVVEVVASPWRGEIEDLDARRGHATGDLRHFLVYIDSHGAYEAVATDWDLRQPSPADPDPAR